MGFRPAVSVSDSSHLISLYGIVVALRAHRPWRDPLNAAGEERG
jgi:hypothetical protein